MVSLDGQPWFVAREVLSVLGIYIKGNGMVNASTAVSRGKLTEDEVTTKQIGGLGPCLLLISESGLYKFIMRAARTRPEVAAFRTG